MIKPKVYHYSVISNTPYTFNFDVDCSTFLVKNMGNENLKLSYGEEIDDESYIIILPKTAEVIYATAVSIPNSETNKITVSSTDNCDVEIRLLEY